MTDPTDAQRLGLAIVHDVGLDWLRRDAFDRLVTALGWLQSEGSPTAIADHLRDVADMLETDPATYLRSALARIEADARAQLKRAA